MMKHEFEALAGYEVSQRDYDNIIEPMYMSTKLNKEDFVKTINKKRFALRPIKSIIKEMRKIAEGLKESCTHYTDYDTQDKLHALAEEYMERKGYIGDWGKIAGHTIETEMLWSCYYPAELVIYSLKDYKTMEVIKLTA